MILVVMSFRMLRVPWLCYRNPYAVYIKAGCDAGHRSPTGIIILEKDIDTRVKYEARVKRYRAALGQTERTLKNDQM
ncbi:MAG: hypothetical protein JXA13_10760 [Anaerolineales bacterium]|nr:hypothetical protein [Anaerolineales bacterium]